MCLAVLLWVAPTLAYFLEDSDHGIPLSMGFFVRMGQVPFVDVFCHYGPLTAYTSAWAMAIEPSLVSEVALCSLGYALSLAVLFRIVRESVSLPAAVGATAAALTVLAKYYKWYCWLSSLLTLLFFQRFLAAGSESKRNAWLLAGGLGAGVMTLYRFDLGALDLLFWGASLFFVMPREERGKVALARFLRVGAGFMIPMAVWLTFLTAQGGFGSIFDYFSYTFHSAVRVVGQRFLPLPLFSGNEPWTITSRLAIALPLLPFFYFLCLREAKRRGQTGRFLAAAAVMGICVLPLFWQRTGWQHLRYALPPLFVAAPLYLRGQKSVIKHALVIGALAALVITAVERNHERTGFNVSIREKYAYLHRIPEDYAEYPVLMAAEFVKRHSSPEDRILVLTVRYQFYYFAQRLVSGHFAVPFDEGWKRWNRDEVNARPPKFLVVPPVAPPFHQRSYFRWAQQELFDDLSGAYNRIVYDDGELWKILGRGGEGRSRVWDHFYAPVPQEVYGPIWWRKEEFMR